MSELQKLKDEYLEIQDKQFSETYTSLIKNTLPLDNIAMEELKSVFMKESLAKECFANTINLMLDEEELIEYLKLFLKHYHLTQEIGSLIDFNHVEKRTEEIVDNFLEDKSEVMNKIYEDSFKRKNIQ